VFPESLDDFSVLMTLTSNSSGEISIESNGGSWGTYTNVLNGFVLSAVPEPSTASLAIGVGALLGLGRRRRRESIR
jgi:MYXO-CTERM domain-containing protein